jgi:hypothetical protein
MLEVVTARKKIIIVRRQKRTGSFNGLKNPPWTRLGIRVGLHAD